MCSCCQQFHIRGVSATLNSWRFNYLHILFSRILSSGVSFQSWCICILFKWSYVWSDWEGWEFAGTIVRRPLLWNDVILGWPRPCDSLVWNLRVAVGIQSCSICTCLHRSLGCGTMSIERKITVKCQGLTFVWLLLTDHRMGERVQWEPGLLWIVFGVYFLTTVMLMPSVLLCVLWFPWNKSLSRVYKGLHVLTAASSPPRWELASS